MSNALLARILRNPSASESLAPDQWNALFSAARGELLFATLAHRLEGMSVPDAVQPLLADARMDGENWSRAARQEALMAARACAGFQGKILLMKGTAYVMAGLKASAGRHVGDLDIMVAKDALPEIEKRLLANGWSWVKEDAYDDAYYRQYMHELPPLLHEGRNKMADVHHTILPLTHRNTPDASAILAAAVALPQQEGAAQLYVMAPADMICHCAAHLIADGDLAGGMRNLWDMHQLLTQYSKGDELFWQELQARAQEHQLWGALHCAARLALALYGTHIPASWRIRGNADSFFVRRLLARDEAGRETRWFTRQAFYLRGHYMRMPPRMLARHLWTKYRKNA